MEYVFIKTNPIAANVPTMYEMVRPQGWRHKISATIGYDTASFDVFGSREYLEHLYFNGLGAMIQRFTPDGCMVIWEGYINDMVLNIPGMRASASLDDMWNKVHLRYTLLNTGVNPPTQTANTVTAAAEDTDSQNRYGVKYKCYVPQINKLTSTMATQMRDVVLDQYKLPRRSANHSPNDTVPRLTINARGYMHTLGWNPYKQTGTSGTNPASTVVATILASDVGQYVANSIIDTNTTAINQYFFWDDDGLTLMHNIASAGDSSGNRWLCYMLDGRTFYYRQAATSIKYIRMLSDQSQLYYDTMWRAVPYYELRPNGWLRTSDLTSFSPDFAELQNEFRSMFIESVTWTEDSNTVALEGSTGDMIQPMVSRLAVKLDRLI